MVRLAPKTPLQNAARVLTRSRNHNFRLCVCAHDRALFAHDRVLFQLRTFAYRF
jgi:hypothetical protein